LQQLAERFAGSDPGKARRFAEEAAVQSRTVRMPERAAALAEAGALLARVGQPDAGRKLIEEATAAVSGIGVTQRQAYVRGRVAGALAPFDLERALALVEPMTEPSDQVRYTAFIASAIAARDPARAVALADGIAEKDNSSTSLTIKT